jgi:hypothetical protein
VTQQSWYRNPYQGQRYTDLVRRVATIAGVVIALATAGLAGASLPLNSMTVTTSKAAAGARHVTLTVTLKYEMQCDYAGAGPVVVTFPAAVKLPKAFAAGSVLLSGKQTAATVSGHDVTVMVAPHTGVMCDVMGPGSLVITFAPTAKLKNPPAGSYSFAARHRASTFNAKLTIR